MYAENKPKTLSVKLFFLVYIGKNIFLWCKGKYGGQHRVLKKEI